MKIWIKILIGTILGIFLGNFLPPSAERLELFDFISQVSIRIGSYVVFPLVFFSLAAGTFELKQEKKLFSVYLRILLYLLLSTFLLILIGVLSVLIFSPERIPIIIEGEEALRLPGLKEILEAVFPKNLFQVLVGSGEVMLPLIFLAFLLGINLSFDLRITALVTQFLDTMNRIFYHINSLVVELFGFALLLITASFVLNLKTYDLGLYEQVLIILALDCALVVFAVYPGLFYLLGGGKHNPYKWLYAVIAPALTAFFTGDPYLSIGMLAKHGKENLGVPRRLGSAVYPLFAYFGRAGTAMIAAVSFILILKSYSSLEISFAQVIWTIGFSLLISLALGPVPGMGAFAAISTLCAVFGKGLQEGYLILKPIAPLLIGFGVLLDVLTSAFVSFLIAGHESIREETEPADFV